MEAGLRRSVTMVAMNLVDLATESESAREQAASLLVHDFDGPLGWPNLELARAEVARVIGEGFALAMIELQTLVGWIGGLPEYDGRVWELHPMVVRSDSRRRGIGRMLVDAFELEARRRGGFTATLGTDDNTGMTSLSGVDLYRDLPRHLAEIHDLGREHPFGFYLKVGFAITGVLPDANGPGKPDIFMSKRLS